MALVGPATRRRERRGPDGLGRDRQELGRIPLAARVARPAPRVDRPVGARCVPHVRDPGRVVGTAAALVAAATPGAASPLRLAAAALVSIATIGFLAWDRAARTVARLVGSVAQFRPLPLAAVAESAGLSLLSWVTYGVAFWLLARGLGLPGALPVARAAGVFAVGYILGLLALFAPGGVGVREVVLIGLLTPALGGGGAVALSLASRILLTLT